MANHARLIGGRPKWPMSAYRASAPVTVSTTEPRAMKATWPWSTRKLIPYEGEIARRIPGWATTLPRPASARSANQIPMTGPNARPTAPVP